MRARRLAVILAGAAAAACFDKPPRPESTGDGGLRDGAGSSTDSGASAHCTSSVTIDGFEGPPSGTCTGSAQAAGGTLEFLGATATCTYGAVNALHTAVFINPTNFMTSSASHATIAQMLMVPTSAPTVSVAVSWMSPGLPYQILVNGVAMDTQPTPPMYIMLQAIDDHTVAAKWADSYYDDLSKWNTLEVLDLQVTNATQDLQSIQLSLQSQGTGTGGVDFTAFDYCP